MQMNIAEAKAKLSELIAAVERGEEVVLARGGHPVVRMGRGGLVQAGVPLRRRRR